MNIHVWRARKRSHEYHCVMYESGWLSGDEERERQRVKRKKRRDCVVLWWKAWLIRVMIAVNGLEDGSISVSSFLRLLYLLPSLACFLTYTSLCLSLSPLLPGFIMATHQQSASLSPNGTAISTNAFQTYSSCHITIWWKVHVFLQSPQSLSFLSSNLVSLFQRVAPRVNSPSAKQQCSSSVDGIRWGMSGYICLLVSLKIRLITDSFMLFYNALHRLVWL